MKILEEADNAVSEINAEFYEWPVLAGLIDDGMLLCEVRSDGLSDIVQFLGHTIWNSGDDSRECNEETGEPTETLDVYLREEINKILYAFNGIRLRKEFEPGNVPMPEPQRG